MDDNPVKLAAVISHEALPVRGTFKRAKDGELLELPVQAWDYPILAKCACGGEIRKKESMCCDWEHLEENKE